MKILFLGLLYNDAEESSLLHSSKCGLQGACNRYQWNLIEGLEEIMKHPVDIYHYLPIGAFPRYNKKLFLPTKEWSHKEAAHDMELGFINLSGIKQFIRQFKMKKAVYRWCKEYEKEERYILIYSLYLPYLKVLSAIKKKYKKVPFCVIIPDLPGSLGFHQKDNLFIKAIKKLFEKQIYKLVKTADTYILLTKDMAKPLHLEDKPYIVVEGILKQTVQQNISKCDGSSKILLYTGSLDKIFGLDILIAAFKQITEPDYQLWLCGNGDYQTEIEKAAKQDGRIKYFGYLPAAGVQEKLKQATLLINPRANNKVYTRYSFPSKTMEYIAAAKPVLMFKLDGIPDEYDDYLFYIKENTVESMKEAILSICSKSEEELISCGEATYRFVVENKNERKQAERILSLLTHTADSVRVLQINITCQYGSTGSIVEELHHYLIKQGYSSSIAYSAFHSDLDGAFKIESRLENYIRRALNRYFGKKHIHSAPGTKRLIRNIKKLKPELIHLHNIQQNSIHFPMLLAFLKKYGVPVVYTLHDCWAFTGGCYHFTRLNCDGYRYGCKKCKLPRSSQDLCNRTSEQIYEEKKQVLYALDKLQLICVSNWLKDCAESSYMKGLPLLVIYNGIDTDIFKPFYTDKREVLPVTEDSFIILGVANHWSKDKGLDLFVQLAGLLKSPYRIVLVGLPAKECPENIITLPRLDNKKELARLYNSADVYLNASKEETFGLTSVEAMACGTPVIAYRSTACAEVLTPDTGILLETSALEEVINAIETIHTNGKESYKKPCAEHARRNFSKEVMLEKYFNVYKSLL